MEPLFLAQTQNQTKGERSKKIEYPYPNSATHRKGELPQNTNLSLLLLEAVHNKAGGEELNGKGTQ